MKRTFFITSAILVVLGAVLSACSQQPTPLTIGTTGSEVNTLLYLAQEQGYFKNNGLDVTLKVYASGQAAIDGMQHNEVQMATGTEYAFAGNVLAGVDVRYFGTIGRFTGEFLVARNDRGIKDLTDLKGKTIGVPMKSRPQFALGRFLDLNKIDSSLLTLVNVSVDKSADALASGQVDAVATWQPYINRIKTRMGNSLVLWSIQNDQPSYNGMIGLGAWTTAHSDTVNRVLRALVQAQSYYEAHSDSTKTIIEKRLNLDANYIAEVWSDYQFQVSLDQPFIIALEDESRWLISNNLTSSKTVPDFLQYIYPDALKAVKPEVVNIIR